MRGYGAKMWRSYNKHNHEHDGHGNPGKALIAMDVPVAIDTDYGGENGNGENSCPERNYAITQSNDQLAANDDVDRRPANTSGNVKERHNDGASPAKREA